MQRLSEFYVGLMSGTSLDGIDAVLVDLGQPKPVLLEKYYMAFDETLKNDLLALHLPSTNELHQSQTIGNQLSRLYAAAVTSLLSRANTSPKEVRAIACHGQTIRHCPEHGYSLQIGNAALLAELSGITVVSDFRSRDIAAGGQGAPLVPAFHNRILSHPDKHRVILNIGGISNLTDLNPNQTTIGFDCGPGNILMDAWSAQHIGKPYDHNGAWAATGNVLPTLLRRMLDESYFTLPPPRSTGRDLFNMAWLEGKLNGVEKPEDVQATLLELSCQAAAQSINQYCIGAREIYLCGGGAHNQSFRNRLADLVPHCSIGSTNELGLDSDYLEAIAFAWMAQQTMHGKPANLPQATGAKHPCLLGAIYQHL